MNFAVTPINANANNVFNMCYVEVEEARITLIIKKTVDSDELKTAYFELFQLIPQHKRQDVLNFLKEEF